MLDKDKFGKDIRTYEKNKRIDRIVDLVIGIVTATAIFLVFFRNAFPQTQEAIIITSVQESEPTEPDNEITSPIDTAEINSITSEPNDGESNTSEAVSNQSSTVYEPSKNIPDTPEEDVKVNSVANPVSEQKPNQSSSVKSSSKAESVPPQPTQNNCLININTASADELQPLSGIGQVKAHAIISYRETNGAFTNVDDIVNVKGIGEKTLEKIRDNICI